MFGVCGIVALRVMHFCDAMRAAVCMLSFHEVGNNGHTLVPTEVHDHTYLVAWHLFVGQAHETLASGM